MRFYIGGATFAEGFYDCGAGVLCSCSDANARVREGTVDLSIVSVSPDDLNNENFDFYFYGSAFWATYIGLIDAAYIRVIYTIPPLKKKIITNGLIFVEG